MRYSSNNVVVISPDVQRHREVLTTDDGLSNPMSLHYSGSKNQLLVANVCNIWLGYLMLFKLVFG